MSKLASGLKSFVRNNVTNALSWKTPRKIVVLESDDWGTIRMASREVYNHLLAKGYPVDQCIYDRLDTLECNEDLELLLEVLTSVRDSKGNPARLTVNNIVANPDFEKIRASDFQSYFFEPFQTTLERYPGRNRVLDLYRTGVEAGALRPQFHGREHVNIHMWMNALQGKNKETNLAFDHQMFTMRAHANSNSRSQFLEAFGFVEENVAMVEPHANIISTGMKMFEDYWGFRSASFIAPCYTWHTDLEPALQKEGCDYLQGSFVQKMPGRNYTLKRHFTGQRSSSNQKYCVRNVFFEPSEDASKDWVNMALREIRNAFAWKTPAIISTHRVNYSGYHDPKNRGYNLRLLSTLLKQIKTSWPDVEFLSSDELGSQLN